MDDSPYGRISIVLDETGTQRISESVHKQYMLHSKHEYRAMLALRSFRGTLVDGTLQPNIRLGNGLQVFGLHSHTNPGMPKRMEKREETALEHETNSRASLQTPPQSEREAPATVPIPKTSPAVPRKLSRRAKRREVVLEREAAELRVETPPRVEHATPPAVLREPDQKSRRQKLALERKAAELQAKEKELEQKAEILRWKYRAWDLEQKLARSHSAISKRRPGSTESARLRRGFDVDRPEKPLKARRRSPKMEEWSPGCHVESTDDHFPLDEFTLGDPTPSPALANLRSRVTAPARQTLGARRRT
jgi:hypothetical protein